MAQFDERLSGRFICSSDRALHDRAFLGLLIIQRMVMVCISDSSSREVFNLLAACVAHSECFDSVAHTRTHAPYSYQLPVPPKFDAAQASTVHIKSVRPGVIDRVGVAVAALSAVVICSQRVTGNDNNAARCRRRPLCSPCKAVL